MEEILETNAIEKWSLKTTWNEYKKTLIEKYSAKYPNHKIVIKQYHGCGASGKGIIDYIVYGINK